MFDLGGSLGFSYYTYGTYIANPSGLRWISYDRHEAVMAGEKTVKSLDLQGITFTTNFIDADGVDILMTCGTLQYLEPSLAQLLRTLKIGLRHLLVNQVPFYDLEQYITVQNLIHSYAPYKIQNCSDFITDIIELGYELIDS